VVELHLGPESKGKRSTEGLAPCRDLGVLYLEEDRLDEAERLFGDLEKVPSPAEYRLLGRMGRGIVLALRSKERESNQILKELFGANGPLRPLKPVERKVMKPSPLFLGLVHQEEWGAWRYWLARARWYNKTNGVPEGQVPWFLRAVFPVTDRPPPPRALGPLRPAARKNKG
jgi:hypothetical protein